MLISKIKDAEKIIRKDMTKEGIRQSFLSNLHYSLAKDEFTTTSHDSFTALAIAIRDRIVERWITTQQSYHQQNVKRVYYLSLEFLIGRLLGNNILNLDLEDETKKAMEDLGLDLEKLRDQELDAGLGNGGLGRLAACFLDSMATMGIPAHGYGIRYDYGIFRQKIINGYQVEAPDEWLKLGNPWEFARPEYAAVVRFYGDTNVYHDQFGRLRVAWWNTQDVVAMPFDIPVVGYSNDVVNTLRLWSARSSEEFDLAYFNSGDYEKAVYDKMFSENISKVLYPNDSNVLGRELRLKQEYFFTAASISDIVRRFRVENKDFRDFPNKASIQLNDTHPALAVVELMRILIDEELLDWDTAWDITVRTFAYTNHTVMPEALESWAVPLFERLLPRHMKIIYEINARFLREVANAFPEDHERLRRMSLIEERDPKRVRMAHLAIIGSHSINGVSQLHTDLIKRNIFRDFYELYPERFNNKTNGITQRRWLKKANPKLSDLVSKMISDKWVTNLDELKKLETFSTDRSFQEKWRDVKRQNKIHLAQMITQTNGIKVPMDSIFDVQVKRIHEYKRQVLFALYIISEYLRMKDSSKEVHSPRTFILAGKAAPGYAMAKLIIKFINSIAEVVNNDRKVRDWFKVVFLENYRVSLAEKIFPASDLSEQISTAGTEASGTGCMKFMVNGALTVGTWDGANIEMAEAVGEENIYAFGLKADQIQEIRRQGYNPSAYIEKSPMLQRVLRMIRNNFFSYSEQGIFEPILNNLEGPDPFLICADFDSYCRIQQKISKDYLDQETWTKKTILNVARSGKFSSDRTIREYAKDIWDIQVEGRK
ncbi:MAG: glycogen/starch/alpha-glucan phosphorylase [Candidatus Omnitrophica bacterium]|nr:glycogen/starch/alpha-glucan phosphorylase [Candidatus Omnitrophota bacterium]